MAILTVIRLKAQPGRGGALSEAMQDALDLTRRNPECLRAVLYTSNDEGDDLLLVEEWTCLQAHDRHVARLNEAGVLEKAKGLLAAPPDVRHYGALTN